MVQKHKEARSANRVAKTELQYPQYSFCSSAFRRRCWTALLSDRSKLLLFFLGIALWPPQSVHAQNKLKQLATGYLRQNNFQAKTVEYHGRKWMALPVTRESWNSFHKYFSFNRNAGKEVMTMVYTPDNAVPHFAVNLTADANGEPQNCYLWGKDNPSYRHSYLKWTGPKTNQNTYYYPQGTFLGRGCVFPIEFTQTQMDFFRNQFGKPFNGNCMGWLSQAPVGDGPDESNLLNWLGFSRSKDGLRICERMSTISRPDRVPVVGVCVERPNELANLSADQIFPAPHPGIENCRKWKPEEIQGGGENPGHANPAPLRQKLANGQVADAKAAAALVGKHVFVPALDGAPDALLRAINQRMMARGNQGNQQSKTMLWSSTNVHPRIFNSPGLKHKILQVSRSNRSLATANPGLVVGGKNSTFHLSQRLMPGGDLTVDTVIVRGRKGVINGQEVVSLGTSKDLTWSAIEQVRQNHGKIIVELNSNMPFLKSNTIPLREVTAYYKNDEQPIGGAAGFSNLITQEIAKQIAKAVPDGAPLQISNGSALCDVGKCVGGQHSVWSEVGGPWLKHLMERGVVDTAKVSYLAGNSDFYRYMEQRGNHLQLRPSSEICNPGTICRVANIVAINSGLEVNLKGDVNATQIGDRLIAGAGSQPDFAEGACRAQGGRSIIGMRSLNKNGQSTIVLDLAGPVTTPCQHVSHIATEWGVTGNLRQLSQADRVSAIINVAHPAHRPGLIRQAQRRNLIDKERSQRLRQGLRQSVKSAHPALKKMMYDFWLHRGQIDDNQHARLIQEQNLPVDLAPFGEIPMPHLP